MQRLLLPCAPSQNPVKSAYVMSSRKLSSEASMFTLAAVSRCCRRPWPHFFSQFPRQSNRMPILTVSPRKMTLQRGGTLMRLFPPLAMSVAASKWRQLSAILLHPSPHDRSPLPISESVAFHQAPALAISLNTFLHYFVAPDEASRQEQTNHLQAVIVECTKLGYVLLSQPSDWQFVFKGGGVNTRQPGVVVCAGLDKLGPPNGSRYSSPRRVVEPVLMAS